MKAEVIKLSENQVEIDGVIYERKAEKRGPRIGQICEFWDGDPRYGRIGILEEMRSYSSEYVDNHGDCWCNCQTLTDPLVLGRTMAPEGAKWIAPFGEGLWMFFTIHPSIDTDGYKLRGGIRNKNNLIYTFPAPTEGYKPLKLWEDE